MLDLWHAEMLCHITTLLECITQPYQNELCKLDKKKNDNLLWSIQEDVIALFALVTHFKKEFLELNASVLQSWNPENYITNLLCITWLPLKNRWSERNWTEWKNP